ncbi:MAG: peptidoglycan bridge formation glycyltransferase FemA/FemB family protein [Patescibacteria group bacterium]
MDIKLISPESLSNFTQSLSWYSGSFFHTGGWAEVETLPRQKVECWGVFDGSTQIGAALVQFIKLPGGRYYAYLPRGPVVSDSKYWEQVLHTVAENLRTKVLFTLFDPPIRTEPTNLLNSHNLTVLEKLKFIKSSDIQPRGTQVLDLTKTPEELLAGMSQKTRYNIHLAEKKGLTWRWGDDSDFLDFWHLVQLTARRGKFFPHHFEHYRRLFRVAGERPVLGPELACRLGIVEYEGKVIAGHLVTFHQNCATYVHGGSDRVHNQLKGPHLLHWGTIQAVQKMGISRYDFWGVQPPDGTRKDWAGFSKFKIGFGGEYIEYVGTHDYPYSWGGYVVYKSIRAAKRLWRKTALKMGLVKVGE